VLESLAAFARAEMHYLALVCNKHDTAANFDLTIAKRTFRHLLFYRFAKRFFKSF